MTTIICESTLGWSWRWFLILAVVCIAIYPYYKKYQYFDEIRKLFPLDYTKCRPYNSIFDEQYKKVEKQYRLDEDKDYEFVSEFISTFKNYLARLYLSGGLRSEDYDVKLECEYIYYRYLAFFCECVLLDRNVYCRANTYYGCFYNDNKPGYEIKEHDKDWKRSDPKYNLTDKGIIVCKICMIAYYKQAEIIKNYSGRKIKGAASAVQYAEQKAEEMKTLIDDGSITIIRYMS